MSNLSLHSWYDASQDHGTPNQAPNATEAIARQPKQFRDDLLTRLEPSNTGTSYLTRALKKHLPSLLLSDGVAVPDDPEEMRWRLFFAHSQDMQGFRADIFTGGPNEENNPYFPNYQGLRDRWPDGKTMLEGLASLWLNSTTQKLLLEVSNPFRRTEMKAQGINPTMELLRGPQGNEATRVFADAFDELKGFKIAHKTNAIIRAYCQNAALLAPHDYCFRTYLRSIVPNLLFPSDDIAAAEAKWRTQIMHDFYHVGPALAPYLIADWLFWFWRGGQISWFDSYKADSVWLKTLAVGTSTKEAVLPSEAATSPEAFMTYCRTLRLPPEWIPAPFWHIAFYGLPPRIVNEVIWLEEAATGEQLKAALMTAAQPGVVTISQPHPSQQTTQSATGWPQTPPLPDDWDEASNLPISQTPDVETTVNKVTSLEDIQVISPIADSQQHSLDGVQPLFLPMSFVCDDKKYYACFTSKEILNNTIDTDKVQLRESPLSTLCRIYLSVSQQEGVVGIALDPFSPSQRILTLKEIKALAAELETTTEDKATKMLVQSDTIKTEDILDMVPLSQAAPPKMINALIQVLQSAGIIEARGVCITYTDFRQTWMVAIPTNNPQIFSSLWQGIMQELRPLAESQAAIPDVALCDIRDSTLAVDFGDYLIQSPPSDVNSLSAISESSEVESCTKNVFTTSSGRQVAISRLLMRHTYGGCLEGTMDTNSKYIRRNVKNEVMKVFPPTSAVVILDNEEKSLPMLQWIAEVRSSSPVHTINSDYSSRLSVCWFTDHFPNQLYETLQQVLAQVDWESNAEDCDIMP